MEALALRHIPAPPLDAFVESIWLYQSSPRPFAQERMMPCAGATLIINLLEDEIRTYDPASLALKQRMSGAAITGAQSRSFVIDTLEQIHVVGIEFHPGGSWPFLDPAADEYSNEHLALKDVWGDHAESLRAQLLAARSAHATFALIENALLARAARPVEHDARVTHAVQCLMKAPQVHTLDRLASHINISPRKFSRLFTQQVGLKPKTFARVQRFQQVLKEVGLGKQIDWATVIAQCGYYDQSHFIHDFRAFSGFTPSDYVARKKVHTRHVPL